MHLTRHEDVGVRVSYPGGTSVSYQGDTRVSYPGGARASHPEGAYVSSSRPLTHHMLNCILASAKDKPARNT